MENTSNNLKFLPNGWTAEEKVMALWFVGSLGAMLFFMILTLLSGFIGGFSVVVSIVALISTMASVITLMIYELNGKEFGDSY